jgi:hypothetical protein
MTNLFSQQVKDISLLKDRHLDEDIYIIASGASMDYIDPSFFDGKTTIGINQVYKKFKCTYLVRKEVKFIKPSLDSGSAVIVSEYDSGNLNSGSHKLNTNKIYHHHLYYFTHLDNQHDKVDTSVIDKNGNKIVVSFSTITSAMHIAAYMGAFNIIICGHDAGLLDGKMNFKGYFNDIKDTPWQNWEQYRNWLKIIEGQTLTVKKKLEEVYCVNIVSLNPFINFGLEGHKYER